MPKLRDGRGSGFLAEVEELLNQAYGHPNGTLALKQVLDLHGGLDIYIPTATEIYVGMRDKTILDEFTGSNYLEIAQKHGLSLRQVRRIVHKKVSGGKNGETKDFK